MLKRALLMMALLCWPLICAAAEEGSIRVQAPRGTRVLLDGAYRGKAPLVLQHVAVGRHVVALLTQPAQTRIVDVSAGREAVVDIAPPAPAAQSVVIDKFSYAGKGEITYGSGKSQGNWVIYGKVVIRNQSILAVTDVSIAIEEYDGHGQRLDVQTTPLGVLKEGASYTHNWSWTANNVGARFHVVVTYTTGGLQYSVKATEQK